MTLGLFVLLQALAGMIWGGNAATPSRRRSRIRGYQVGGHRVLFSPERPVHRRRGRVAGGRALVVLFQRTTLGLRMRAAAFDPEVARLLGVRGRRGCSRSAGRWPRWSARWPACWSRRRCFVAPNNFDAVLVFGFTAAVIGGLDSPGGAVIGGLVLGLRAVSYVAGYLERRHRRRMCALVILIAVLMVRPERPVRRTRERV